MINPSKKPKPRFSTGDLYHILFLFFPLLFLYIIEVPKSTVGLPVSPSRLFMVFYIYISLIHKKELHQSIHSYSAKIALLFFILIIYQYIIQSIMYGTQKNLSILDITGIILCLKIFIRNNVRKGLWAVRILGVILTISMTWYIVEVTRGSPIPLRMSIYHSVFQMQDSNKIRALQSALNGLSTYLFAFGYQVAAAVPLCVMMVTTEKSNRWRIFWIFGSISSILSLIFSAERSVLAASSISLILFIFISGIGKSTKIKRTLWFFFIFIISVNIFYEKIALVTTYERQLFSRFEDENIAEDNISRMNLQITALKVILNNPLGLSIKKESWADAAKEQGEDFVFWNERVQTVHNGYLGRIIIYGWVFGLLEILILTRLLFAIKRSVFHQYDPKKKIITQVLALTLLSILIQALGHNASIFTFNPVSLITMFLFLALYDLSPEISR